MQDPLVLVFSYIHISVILVPVSHSCMVHKFKISMATIWEEQLNCF